MDLYIAMATAVLLEQLKDKKWVERNGPRIRKIWVAAGIALGLGGDPLLGPIVEQAEVKKK